MDFKAGTAVVVAKSEESFDPEKVREFLKKSGFSIPKLKLTVRGRLEKWKDMLALRAPGLDEVLVLAGGEKLQELAGQGLVGREVRVEGLLHPLHAEQPGGLTVEAYVVWEAKP